MENLHQQLQNALEEYRTLQKVRVYHQKLTDRLEKENVQLIELEKTLRKEERQIKRLEGTSVASLFHNILGDREKQLEKERQEYLHAALKYNEMLKSVEIVGFEIDVLDKKLLHFDDKLNRYQSLLAAREKELMALGGETAVMLQALHDEIDRGQVLLVDIKEALTAGNESLDWLKKIEKSLKEARDWGQWDTYGKGGAGDWAKHHAVDRAREMLGKARHALIRFDNELRDVYDDEYLNIHIGIEDIDKFTDIFFDNLIVDWIVQQKINRALKNIRKVRSEVEKALENLRSELPATEQAISEMYDRREKMVVNSKN